MDDVDGAPTARELSRLHDPHQAAARRARAVLSRAGPSNGSNTSGSRPKAPQHLRRPTVALTPFARASPPLHAVAATPSPPTMYQLPPRIALPGVCALICFLAYSSQLLLRGLDPGPPSGSQTLAFNALLAALWVSYARACLVDAGRIPRAEPAKFGGDSEEDEAKEADGQRERGRWCRKCDAYKPPRAHHCKVCRRCVSSPSSLSSFANRESDRRPHPTGAAQMC